MLVAVAVALASASAALETAVGVTAGKKMNVLFAIFDDLRPQLSMYNNRSWMHTPHIQQLSERSLVFESKCVRTRGEHLHRCWMHSYRC